MRKACNFIKNETLAQVFSCEFCEISKNTFFTEHLLATASDYMWSKNMFISFILFHWSISLNTAYKMFVKKTLHIKYNPVFCKAANH